MVSALVISHMTARCGVDGRHHGVLFMVQSCGESGGGRVGSGRALERQVVGKAAPLTDAGACGDGPSSAARRLLAPLVGRI